MGDDCNPVDEDLFHVVKEPGFIVLFMLGADDQVDTVEDVDAELRLPDGSRWSATCMTLGAIEVVLNRWKETGEYGGGVFFQCPDLVIIPKPGVAAMIEAFRAIMTEGPKGILNKLE